MAEPRLFLPVFDPAFSDELDFDPDGSGFAVAGEEKYDSWFEEARFLKKYFGISVVVCREGEKKEADLQRYLDAGRKVFNSLPEQLLNRGKIKKLLEYLGFPDMFGEEHLTPAVLEYYFHPGTTLSNLASGSVELNQVKFALNYCILRSIKETLLNMIGSSPPDLSGSEDSFPAYCGQDDPLVSQPDLTIQQLLSKETEMRIVPQFPQAIQGGTRESINKLIVF